jgi:hypothetical protein
MYVWRDAGVAAALIAGASLRVAFGGFRGPLLVFAGIFILCGILATRLPSVGRECAPAPT